MPRNYQNVCILRTVYIQVISKYDGNGQRHNDSLLTSSHTQTNISSLVSYTVSFHNTKHQNTRWPRDTRLTLDSVQNCNSKISSNLQHTLTLCRIYLCTSSNCQSILCLNPSVSLYTFTRCNYKSLSPLQKYKN